MEQTNAKRRIQCCRVDAADSRSIIAHLDTDESAFSPVLSPGVLYNPVILCKSNCQNSVIKQRSAELRIDNARNVQLEDGGIRLHSDRHGSLCDGCSQRHPIVFRDNFVSHRTSDRNTFRFSTFSLLALIGIRLLRAQSLLPHVLEGVVHESAVAAAASFVAVH